jgi:hypothetical protein
VAIAFSFAAYTLVRATKDELECDYSSPTIGTIGALAIVGVPLRTGSLGGVCAYRSLMPRLFGIALILAALGYVLGLLLGDPAIEDPETKEALVERVEDVSDRIPTIYVFQVVGVVASVFLLGAGLGLYLLLGDRARGAGLAGLLLFVLSAVFNGVLAMVGAAMTLAADDYTGGGLAGIGSESDSTLELIRSFAVFHFACFLAGFGALGLGCGSFAYGLAWQAAILPRWLGWLGVVAAALAALTPLAVTATLLFLPFFIGAILTVVWLLASGVWLTLRAPAMPQA